MGFSFTERQKKTVELSSPTAFFCRLFCFPSLSGLSSPQQSRLEQTVPKSSTQKIRRNHFCQISGNKGNHARSQSRVKAHTCRVGQPSCSEEIQHRGSQNHAKQCQRILLSFCSGVPSYKNTCNGCQKNITDEIAACGTQKLLGSSCIAGKNRKASQTQQQINHAA